MISGWPPTVPPHSPPAPDADAPKADPALTAALSRETTLKVRVEKQAHLIIALHEALRFLLNAEDAETPINGGPSAIVRASEALALHEELRGAT